MDLTRYEGILWVYDVLNIIVQCIILMQKNCQFYCYEITNKFLHVALALSRRPRTGQQPQVAQRNRRFNYSLRWNLDIHKRPSGNQSLPPIPLLECPSSRELSRLSANLSIHVPIPEPPKSTIMFTQYESKNNRLWRNTLASTDSLRLEDSKYQSPRSPLISYA